MSNSIQLLSDRLGHRAVNVVLAALCLVFGAAAHGQVSERTSIHLRNDCRLAAQVLEKGHPKPHDAWAIEIIGQCEESGGPALSRLWLSPPSDSTALEQLFDASYSVRDGRIYDTVVPVARDRSLPALTRIMALRVLASYLDPYVVTSMRYMRPPKDSGSFPQGFSSHTWQVIGTEPLPPNARNTTLALFNELGQGDTDPEVRHAARYLARVFRE